MGFHERFETGVFSLEDQRVRTDVEAVEGNYVVRGAWEPGEVREDPGFIAEDCLGGARGWDFDGIGGGDLRDFGGAGLCRSV